MTQELAELETLILMKEQIDLFPPLQNDDVIGGHGCEDPALA